MKKSHLTLNRLLAALACLAVMFGGNCLAADEGAWMLVQFDKDRLTSGNIPLGGDQFRIMEIPSVSENAHGTFEYYILEKNQNVDWHRIYTEDDNRGFLAASSSAGDCADEEVSFYVHKDTLYGVKAIRNNSTNASVSPEYVEIRIFRLDPIPPPVNMQDHFLAKILTRTYPLDEYCEDLSGLVTRELKLLP